MPAEQHHRQVAGKVPCVVLTVSDTRTPATDDAGRSIRDALTEGGHLVINQAIIPDDPNQIAECLGQSIDDPNCRAILLTGGTGLSPRDSTYEVIDAMLDKRLDGFGELFRSLSYDQIGPAAMLTRALAGTVGSTVIFSMPGSPDAVRLALQKLILPELGHIAHLLAD